MVSLLRTSLHAVSGAATFAGKHAILTCGCCTLSADMKLPSGKRKTKCVVSLVGPGGFLIKPCFLGYI